MLKDVVNQFEKIYLATGYPDLRRGIDGLAEVIHREFDRNPYDKDSLFLFCGRRSDRIKGLLWEGDGFLLLYKRVDSGRFQWPRTEKDIWEITADQLIQLLSGFSVIRTINPVEYKYVS